MEQYRTCSTCKKSKLFKDFNKDKSRKFGISYRCKQCHAQMNTKYYDKEKMRIAASKSYHKNKDAINQKAREKRKADPEQYRSYKREYYRLNKKRILANANKWRKANPEPDRAAKRRRRARLRNSAIAPYSTQQVIALYGTNCHLCGKPIDMNAPRWTAVPGYELGLHLDHVIRISEGGPDTIENIRPAHGICNQIKR